MVARWSSSLVRLLGHPRQFRNRATVESENWRQFHGCCRASLPMPPADDPDRLPSSSGRKPVVSAALPAGLQARVHSTALSRLCAPRRLNTTTYHNFIDGSWVPSVSGEVFENRNPADTDDLVGLFQKSTARRRARAPSTRPRRAYARWRLVPAPRRAEMLFRAAQLIADRKEALARDMTREMGKVLDETRGDVQEAIDMTFFMAGEGRRQYGQTVPSELRDKFAMSVRQPLGVSADHHAVEFSDGDPVVEDHPGARLRQHGRLQARDADAAVGAELRPDSRRGGHSARRRQPRDRRRRGSRGTRSWSSDAVRVVSFTGSTEVGRTGLASRPRPRSRRCTSRWAARTSS